MIVCVIWGVLSYLTPKPSKMLMRASMFHQTLLFMMMGNRVLRVLRCKVMPEGYLETQEKKGKHHYIPIARPIYHTPVEGQNEEEKAESKELNEAMDKLEKSTLGVTSFEGCRVPIYLCYSGVALAVNAETVLGLSNDKQSMDCEVPQLEQTETRVQEKGKDVIKKALVVSGKKVVQVLLPINPENIKKFLGMLVDQATIDGIHQDGWDEGYHTHAQAKNEKLILYIGLAMMVIGAVLTGLNLFIK